MKVRTTTTPEQKTFRPFEISITVESIEEAVFLWHRFDLCVADLRKAANTTGNNPPFDNINYDNPSIWVEINRELKKQGYYHNEVLRGKK